MTVRYIIGDALDVLQSMPESSADLVLSSPPFLALRSYLPADHPDKAREIGSEATPGEYIDALLDVVEECRRVLAPHGSLVFELGDTYAGSGGAGGDYADEGWRAGQAKSDGPGRRQRAADEAAGILTPRGRSGPSGRDKMSGWPLDKSLSLIPESFRFALAYGRNPHTGREMPRWRVRNVIAWSRSNPPVGGLGDKVRPATSYVTIACTSVGRWFDLDAVRTESDYDRPNLRGQGSRAGDAPEGQRPNCSDHTTNPAGAPPRDWWNAHVNTLNAYFAGLGKNGDPSALNATNALADAGLLDTGDHLLLNPGGYPGAHYAVYPPELVTMFIESMCPRRVCTKCGEPSRRIVETSRPIDPDDSQRKKHADGERPAPGRQDRAPEIGWEVERATTGWTDCGHDNWRSGLVLDPFAGTGTTGLVAQGHGRDAVLIDIDPRNAELARDRIGGLFLTIEEHRGGEAG